MVKKATKKKTTKTKPAKNQSMMKMEREYQADYDLETLIRADQIKGDKTRLSAAKKAAKKRASEAQKVVKKLK